VKTTLLILFLTCLGLWGQVQPPPGNPTPTAPPPALPTITPAPTNTIISRTVALPQPPRRADSIVVPSSPVVPAGIPGDTVAVSPPPGITNTAPEDMIPAGLIDFRGVDLKDVLKMYAELRNRTILRPANLAAAQQIVLTTQTPLTRREAVQALEVILSLNGIAMIDMGDKFVKAQQSTLVYQEGADLTAGMRPSCRTWANT